MFVLWKYGRTLFGFCLIAMVFSCFGINVNPFDAPYGFIHYPQTTHYILVLNADTLLEEKVKTIKQPIQIGTSAFEIPPLEVVNFQLPIQDEHWKLIQEFPNFGVAKKFMARLELTLHSVDGTDKYDLYLISKTNYRHLLLKKKWDRYLEFYEELSD